MARVLGEESEGCGAGKKGWTRRGGLAERAGPALALRLA